MKRHRVDYFSKAEMHEEIINLIRSVHLFLT